MTLAALLRDHAARAKEVVTGAYNDINRNHTTAMAAGLSYYFVLSLFPLLILLAALLGYLPIPNLFDQTLALMARVVPAESMNMVRKLLSDILRPNRGGLLTFGIVGTLWSASGGFGNMMEALNVAYNVSETRPWWKKRLLALGLTFIEGALLVTALALMVVGPQFGAWAAGRMGLNPEWAVIWPYFRLLVAVVFVVFAVEMLYFWAPNLKQRFWTTLPGAVVGVVFWIASSEALGWYFRHYAASSYSHTYGKLGAAIALLVWLYWSSFAILAGAEINSELLKRASRQTPPEAVTPQPAWVEHPQEPAA